MQMNSFTGKQFLSLIRDSDYAHAGEEEAVELAMRNYPARADQVLLDVGCGRGGTAKYLRDKGWGRVVGIDIEPDSIARARRIYSGIEFHACDVADASSVLSRGFDLICHFNSFYAFPDQPRALAALAHVARDSGRLMIFDYTDRGDYDDTPLECDGEAFLPHPVKISAIDGMLRQAGWALTAVEDLTDKYQQWYAALLARIDRKRTALIEAAGDEGFAFIRKQYAGLLAAIENGSLGGAIIHARKV